MKFLLDFIGVIYPMALEQLSDDLKNVNFVALCCDTSNHGNLKILPVILRYFLPEMGTQSKLGEVFQLENETSETLFEKLKIVWEKFGLRDKVMCLAGDNCPTNFGGVTRGGERNLFSRLQCEFNGRLIGSGCNAHLVHKSIQNACRKFQPFFDLEATVVNIYNYFKLYTVRNTRLQRLYSVDADDEIKLLGYASTRFLGLKKCTDRIFEHFDVLKIFFLAETDAPIALLNFFEHPLSKLLLVFIRDECSHFEHHIRCMESAHVSGYEAAKSVSSLIESIRLRKEEHFTSFDFQREMDNLEENLPFTVSVGKQSRRIDVLVDEQYIKEMIERFYGE